MNGQIRFESEVRAYLHAHGSGEAPPDLLARGMSGVRHVPQRRSWISRMSAGWLATGLGTAAMVAAAVLIAFMIGLLPPAPIPVGPSPSSSPAETPCSPLAADYNGTVAGAFHTTVGIVRGMTAIKDNPQLAGYVDSDPAWLCYIDGEIPKGPASGAVSFDRAILVVVGDQAYFIAAGYRQSMTIETPMAVPLPTGVSTASPSASPTPGCKAVSESPYYLPVGMIQGRIDLIAQRSEGCGLAFTLLSIDPTTGQSVADDLPGDVMPFLASTDGSSLAVPLGTGNGILVIDRDGRRHEVARPAGVEDDWDAYGLPPLPGGGYLVTGPERLLRIAADGSGLTSDPLPAGYVAVAPTSNADSFILATTEDAHTPYGLSAKSPFAAYLWTIGGGPPVKVAENVQVIQQSDVGLAELRTGDVLSGPGTWSLLDTSGRLTALTPNPGFGGTLSPNGRWLVTETNIGSNGNDVYQVSLVRVSDGKRIATWDGSGGVAGWEPEGAVILMQSQLPRTFEPRLVVVDDAGVQHAISLP